MILNCLQSNIISKTLLVEESFEMNEIVPTIKDRKIDK